MLKLLMAALMALAPISAATPEPRLAPNSTLYSDATPPTRYQGAGVAVVLMVEPSQIDAYCGAAPAGYTKIACSGKSDGAWIIIMPNPCAFDTERFAHILCHEKAHTAGWPATHGD